MLGELAIILSRRLATSFLFFFLSVLGDLFRFPNGLFQCTDHFGSRFIAEVQKQLAVAVDAAITPSAKELLKQLVSDRSDPGRAAWGGL